VFEAPVDVEDLDARLAPLLSAPPDNSIILW